MDAERRAAVLGRVRKALATTRPLALPPSTHAVYPRPESLVHSFVAASAWTNADAEVLSDAAAVASRVLALARGVSAKSIVVSPRAALPPWSIGDLSNDIALMFANATSSEDIGGADVGVTVAAYALADTGTVVSLACELEGRLESVLPPVHIAIVPASVIVPDMAALFDEVVGRRLLERHSSMVFITGPSRTADIELTLTIGVHGPKSLRLLIVDDRSSRGSNAEA